MKTLKKLYKALFNSKPAPRRLSNAELQEAIKYCNRLSTERLIYSDYYSDY